MVGPSVGPTALETVCRERRRLTESLISEMDNVVSIAQRYTAALARYASREEIKAVSDELESAIRFRASLIERYNAHLDAHGCDESTARMSR